MMKRELDKLADAAADVDGPRQKRRREEEDEQPDLAKTQIEGIKLWSAIKNARNSEGREMSADFLRLPSKRQYPDYYQTTKHPIALEDIKLRLETNAYTTLESVKLDLDNCFRNAKKYNLRDSQIWKDAKHLQKLVSKEYAKMTGTVEDARVDVEHDDNFAGSDDDGGKKKKAPNLIRLLKARLQKLVDKTDDSGRVLSSEFMDLPSKKQWPLYYKTIKKPQCFESIFKRLKRKEYFNTLEFSKEVELVFSNAMEFNAEGSQIYEDARVLRDHFRQLMSDLPPSFAIPEYSTQASGSKIMLKVPAAATSTPTVATTMVKPNPSVTLRVPGQTSNDVQQQSQPHPAPIQIHTASPNPIPAVVQRTPSQVIQHQMTPSTSYVPNSHYPNVAYQQTPIRSPAPTYNGSIASPLPPVVYPDSNTQLNPQSQTLTKSPVPMPIRLFRSMLLTTKPQERKLELNHSEGVKVWAMRAGKNESSLCITEIKFVTLEEEEEEDTESRKDSDKEEEEEEEEDVPAEPRRRGRPRKKGKGKETPKPSKPPAKKRKLTPPEDEILVKLNGVAIQLASGSSGQWDVDLPLGQSVIEVSEKGGALWKVYVDKSL